MRRMFTRFQLWFLTAAAGGSIFFLEGCDPTLRATFESGLITTSQSLFASFLQALIGVAQESAAA